jgi:hypothetical protein
MMVNSRFPIIGDKMKIKIIPENICSIYVVFSKMYQEIHQGLVKWQKAKPNPHKNAEKF